MWIALTRLDTRVIPDSPGEIRGFLLVRNEIRRLPFTLAHHRTLGVGRFFVLDNGSTDGTLDYLLSQPDVHVYQTRGSYLEARLGIDWLETMLTLHGDGHWCVVLDGDEHLVYPDCEFFRLPEFCAALEQHSLDCLVTIFIDLYADAPIAETRFDGRPLLEICSYFDAKGYYNFPPNDTCMPRFYGGPRARLFWPEVDLRHDAGRIKAYVEDAFDEQAYLTLHPDIRGAIADGTVRSGLDHFLRYGHHEGRTMVVRALDAWPEETYLSINPDVKDAVQQGTFTSGLDHYVRYGQFEARGLLGPAPPCLSQAPLLRWNSHMRLDVGRHRLSGASWRRNDAVGGALLHFKLMEDLAPRADNVAAAVVNDAEPAWSLENRRYRDVLRDNRGLSAMGDSSVRYDNARQLIQLGIITPVSDL
jgi:hypothetical protein